VTTIAAVHAAVGPFGYDQADITAAFSAVVSLIIVPVFYVWFDDLNLWRKRVFTRARPADELPQTGLPQAEPGT
jgi:hypothetical protein